MQKHNGYATKSGELKCTKCSDWIENGEEAMLIVPCEVGDSGVERNAKAIYGVLCVECYGRI